MSLFDSFQSGQANAAGPDPRRQFLDHVKLKVYEDGYIDREEERKILEAATALGIGVDAGLALMRELASQNGWVIERELEARTREMLERFAQSGGSVDKKEFNDAVALLRSGSRNKFSEAEARRRIKQIVLDAGWQVKEGGLFGAKWFSEIS